MLLVQLVQLLFHQFLAGLPVSISNQLRAVGDVMTVETALEWACSSMPLEVQLEQRLSMVTTTSIPEQHQQVRELKQQVEEFTTQVATLVHHTTLIMPVQRQPPNLQCCFEELL